MHIIVCQFQALIVYLNSGGFALYSLIKSLYLNLEEVRRAPGSILFLASGAACSCSLDNHILLDLKLCADMWINGVCDNAGRRFCILSLSLISPFYILMRSMTNTSRSIVVITCFIFLEGPGISWNVQGCKTWLLVAF